jgi:hypothetical protein
VALDAQAIDFHQAADAIEIGLHVGGDFEHELHEIDFTLARQ